MCVTGLWSLCDRLNRAPERRRKGVPRGLGPVPRGGPPGARPGLLPSRLAVACGWLASSRLLTSRPAAASDWPASRLAAASGRPTLRPTTGFGQRGEGGPAPADLRLQPASAPGKPLARPKASVATAQPHADPAPRYRTVRSSSRFVDPRRVVAHTCRSASTKRFDSGSNRPSADVSPRLAQGGAPW